MTNMRHPTFHKWAMDASSWAMHPLQGRLGSACSKAFCHQIQMFTYPIIFRIAQTSVFLAFRAWQLCLPCKTSARIYWSLITQKLVVIRPKGLLPLEFSGSKAPHQATEWHYLDTKVPSPSPHPLLVVGPQIAALYGFLLARTPSSPPPSYKPVTQISSLWVWSAPEQSRGKMIPNGLEQLNLSIIIINTYFYLFGS